MKLVLAKILGLFIVSTLVLGFPFSAEGASQSPDSEKADLERPVILSIDFKNDDGTPLPAEKFQPLLTQKPGALLDLSQLAKDVQKITDEFPEYINITTQIIPTANKGEIKISFDFLRKRIVRSVQVIYPNDLKKAPEKLRERLQIKMGRILTGQALSQDIQILKNAFIAAGYPKVQIKNEVNTLDAKRATVAVIYHVIPGSPLARIANVEIDGNNHIKTEKIVASMKAKKPWHSGVTGDMIFNAIDLEGDKETIKALYDSHGYADVSIKTSYAINDSGKVFIQVNITEGTHYSVKRIEVSGNNLFSDQTIRSALTFQEGASYDGKAFRVSMQKIREMYGERGYSMAQVLFNFDIKSSKLNIEIKEGTVQYIERISIKGNSTTNETFIRKYLHVSEGDIANTKSVTDSINALRSTGYFKQVNIQFTPSKERSNFGELTIIVDEADTNSISVGFGYGTVSGLQGDASLTQNNISGAGFDFSIQAMKSAELTKLLLLFKDRHVFGSDYELTAYGGYTYKKLPNYDKETYSARAVIEKEVIKNLTIGIGTRLEFVDIQNIAGDMPQEVIDSVGKVHVVSGLVSTMVYSKEKLNDSGDAVGGYKIQMALLPSFADSQVFYKSSATLLAHQTVGENGDGQKDVLTGRITIGFASENTPFYERLSAGGNTTIRGFQNESINPNNSKVGGSALVSGGAYYSFPLASDKFRGVVFAESASVGNGIQQLGDVRVVGGIGVRANLGDTFLRNKIEGGFAFPAIKQPGDSVSPFYLMIGNYHPAYDL